MPWMSFMSIQDYLNSGFSLKNDATMQERARDGTPWKNHEKVQVHYRTAPQFAFLVEREPPVTQL